MKKFVDYLKEKGLLTQKGFDKILNLYKHKGGSLVELLISLGYVKEPQMVDALSSYLSIPPIRILHLNIPKAVLSLIPQKIACDYKVVPISKISNTLTLAMGDPLNILVIDNKLVIKKSLVKT